ncbi:MAG: acylphosphatase [Acidithiobacillales bacterium]
MPAEKDDAGWEIVRRRYIVKGRVQGVGYRAFAARVARTLRLSGGASNLEDGRVEIVAEGPAHALERFESALSEGPRLARVDDLSVEAQAQGAAATAYYDVEF